MKRKYTLKETNVKNIAEAITGVGYILKLDHEGTITYELEGDSARELNEREQELHETLHACAWAGCEIKQIEPTTYWLITDKNGDGVVNAAIYKSASKPAQGTKTTVRKATQEDLEAFETLGGKVDK